VTAIDGSAEMIAFAMRDAHHAGGECRVADLTGRMLLPDRYFNLVLANMVLMDIPRIDVAITEFARMLTRRGAFVRVEAPQDGMIVPSVSAGSSHRAARETCTPHVMVPSGAA
jgi:ubiquinone/menaquinone biosynthesis C-methylase UbiE